MTKSITPQLKMPLSRELEWVQRLRDGDKAALAELYDAYSACLYGVILQITGIEPIAQDVLQEVFLKIWKKIHSYESSKGKLFTWMLNIARNAAIDKTRSRMFREGAFRNTAYPGIEPSYCERIDFIGIREIIDLLKPVYKEVIDLLYFKGMTQAEAAKALELPLGTVKTRSRAAINQLRNLLDK